MSDHLKKTLEETLTLDIKQLLDEYAEENGLTILPTDIVYGHVLRGELTVEQLGAMIDYVNTPEFDCGSLYEIIEPYYDNE